MMMMMMSDDVDAFNSMS